MAAHPCVVSVPARVDVALANGAPEEALAAVTAGGSVVFPCGLVPADGTVGGDPVWTGQAGLRRHAVCIAPKPIQVNTHAARSPLCSPDGPYCEQFIEPHWQWSNFSKTTPFYDGRSVYFDTATAHLGFVSVIAKSLMHI